jgi:YbbR domain-containing protein
MISLFKRYVLHNFWLKALSLVMAGGLWWAISPDDQPAEVAVRAPIVFLRIPSHLELSNENIPDAQIRVRGPERVIRRLLASDVHAEIDLGAAQPGEQTFDLTAQQVRHPRDLAVVQVVPSQVHLTFDTQMTREVEIHPDVKGAFSAGEIQVQVDPEKITISGPSRHVERVNFATTDPVDASNIVDRVIFVTNAYISDPLVQVLRPAPVHVTVTRGKAAAKPAH